MLLRRLLVAFGCLRQKWTKEQVPVTVVVERNSIDAAQEVTEAAQLVHAQHHLSIKEHPVTSWRLALWLAWFSKHKK